MPRISLKESAPERYKGFYDKLPDKRCLKDFNMIPDGLSRNDLKLRLRLEMAMRDHWIKSKRWHSNLDYRRAASDEYNETVEDRIPTWSEGLVIRNGRIEELRKRIERGFR